MRRGERGRGSGWSSGEDASRDDGAGAGRRGRGRTTYLLSILMDIVSLPNFCVVRSWKVECLLCVQPAALQLLPSWAGLTPRWLAHAFAVCHVL